MSKLTPKQEMFCKEYLVDLNATQAAIRSGYSKHTAKDIGCQNLAKLYIQERIQELMTERSNKVLITAEDVLTDIIDTRGTAAQEGKLSERLKANELLGKHLAMWTDKTQLGQDPDNPVDWNITVNIPDANKD